ETELRVQDQKRDGAEREQRERIDVPTLLAVRIHAGNAVDQAVDGAEHAITRCRTVRIHLRQVRAEQWCRYREQRDDQQQLEPAGHQSFSGAISAYTRYAVTRIDRKSPTALS